ncbi:MAG: LCP family protein [Clostridia bacterium]|nr:LCP family protein [Clostridia bacterium]
MSKNVTFRTQRKSKNSNKKRITIIVALALILLVFVSFFAVLSNSDFDLRTALGGDPGVTAGAEEETAPAEKSDRCFLFWCKDSVSNDLQFLWVTRIIMPKGKYIIYSPSVDESIEYRGEYKSIGNIFYLYGIEGLEEALEQYCDIDIEHNIGSDTEAFKQMVNNFGSVTVELKESINYKGSFNLILPRGSNVIKGDTLYKYLVYTNFNHVQSEEIRAKAFEEVLKNVINEDNIDNIEKIYSRIANLLYTDITIVVFTEMCSYINDLFITGVKETVAASKPNQI